MIAPYFSILFLLIFFPCIIFSQLHNPKHHLSDELYQKLSPYLLPMDHPVKKRLDRLFKKVSVLRSIKTLKKRGFECVGPQPFSKVVICKHPQLKGFVIKAYAFNQEMPDNRMVYLHWIQRIKGSRLIRQFLEDNNYTHLFAVPRKWIYMLPVESLNKRRRLDQLFVLVEDDMNLQSEKINTYLWGSNLVTRETLKALYEITTCLGLFDCAKPSNCSFTKEGKLAFVDTQIFHIFKVKYELLTPYLSPKMQVYWKKLINQKRRTLCLQKLT